MNTSWQLKGLYMGMAKANTLRLALIASVLAFLLLPFTAEAVPGIQTTLSGPDYGSAKYEETVIDLKIKVQGGFINHKRTLEDGIDWQFNRAWASLELQYAIGDDPQVDLPIMINRNEFSYEPVGSQSTPTYVFDERRWITKTASGWRWQDRRGNWIDYDSDGKVTSYGDRNNVTVSFTRDVEGRIETIKDHNGTVVLTYTYDAITGLLERVTDYTNREVSYSYNALRQLETVTDVRGEVWTYGYTDFGKADIKLLTSITDPETNIKTISYEIQEGMVCVEATGGTWSFDEATGDWGLRNARCASSASQPPSALLKSVSDEEGIIGQYKFFYVEDGDNSLFKTATVDGEGGLMVETFNLDGEVIEVQRNGRVVSQQEIDGRTRRWTDENGRVTEIQYDQWDNPIKEIHADGNFILREFDATYSTITRYINKNGIVTQYDYDANGNRIRTTEAVGLPEQRITEFKYDAFGNRTEIKTIADSLTEESTIIMTYDGFGNLKTHTDAEAHLTEYLVHDALGNTRQKKDARGKIWSFEFDAAGNPISETTAMGLESNYEYDKAGNRTKIIDADQKETAVAYDKRNRLIGATNPLFETRYWTYNKRNQIVATRNAQDHERTIEYNQDGQRIGQTDPSGNLTTWDYGYSSASDFKGRVNTINYPTFQELLTYDDRYRLTSRLRSSSDTPNQVTEFRYDRVGLFNGITHANNRTEEIHRDALNRPVGVLDTANQLSQLTYDNRNNLAQVTNARDIVIRDYQYDRNKRLLKDLLPDGNALKERSYDPNGNLERGVDGKGQVAVYTYDDDNRLTEVNYFADVASAENPSNAEKTVTFTYDNLNRLKTYNDGSTDGSFNYDAAGRMLDSTVNYGSFSLSQRYTYYPSGLKKTYTGPDNITYIYSYDDGGRLQSVIIPGQGNYFINQYKWNKPVLVTLPGGGRIISDYDGYMRNKRIQGLDPAGNSVLDLIYSFDLKNNVKIREALESRTEYDFDNADRLIEVQTFQAGETAGSLRSYTYDAAGNRESDSNVVDAQGAVETWLYDDADRLLQRGGVSYQYDANGSRTRQSDSGSGQTTNYLYNIENRLTEVRDQSDNLIASYSYDPFGRRVSKTVGASTIYYFYAIEGLVAEIDENGNITTTYGYQANEPWGTDPMFIRQGNQYAYYITDHLGAPQIAVGSNGGVLWQGVYDAFGTVNVTTSTIDSNLRFPGQYYDNETGLHYNYLRYYDPSVGQYISTDPVGLYAGLNTYGYVLGNPLSYIDPPAEAAVVAVIGLGVLTVAVVAAAIHGIQSMSDYDDSIPSPAPDYVIPVDPAPQPNFPNGDKCQIEYLEDRLECQATCGNAMSYAACQIRAYIKWLNCTSPPPDDYSNDFPDFSSPGDPGYWPM